MAMQRALAERCSGTVAVDGHVIGSCSRLNGLASKGHRFANLLTALDAKTGTPICSRLCEGRVTDRLAVRDLLCQVPFSGVIFLVDRGFGGEDNEALFTERGNHYICPLGSSESRCREAAADLELPDEFLWRRGQKSTLVRYAERRAGGRRIVVCRDLLEQLETQANCRRHMERGDSGYTEEGLGRLSPYMGLYVLQTSLPAEGWDAASVFALNKERWTAETYFDYFKNGLAFAMLVSGLIECKVRKAVASSGLGMSVTDVLMDARAAKADRIGDAWVISNCLKKHEERFRRLGVALEAAHAHNEGQPST